MSKPQRSPSDLPSEMLEALGLMQPEDIGPIVVKGLRASRPLIITHPRMIDDLRRRQNAQLADFGFFGN
jgi:hypothetical protein